MSLVIIVIIFFVSLITIVGILYWQWKRVQSGKIEIVGLKHDHHDHESPITIRDIAILILYIIKHTLQFIIIQLSKIYFLILRKIKNLREHKNPKIAKILNNLKVPPIPPTVKSFIQKTIDETKQKIGRVKADLAHLEESIEKRVD
jgi:hypothetical protein